MATPSPPDLNATREADYKRFKNYAAYTFLIGAPILIALPPRKLDPLTVLVLCSFGASANHIVHDRTGRSIVDRIDARISRMQGSFSSLPSERAQEIQERLRAARDAQLRQAEQERLKAQILSLSDKQRRAPDPGLKEEIEKLKARQAQEEGVMQRVWMGGESEGWKERRLREEQKALSEGKGYGDLIQEHIWDVWTWGGKDGKTGEAVTDETVAEKKD
ncbi:Ankyrin repeats (3 copies) family protein [Penicillium digitatum]|uniref:Rhomboid family membrane protein n=2 Tax=Penicillium digitatum TaxID=36651 RepID=K9G5E4_PEND1|nr:hypothetical protein PDIP_37740 [Penicillium digitatum Pd1]EKV16162.1 hypothetical protein PDIP_37740 [Penicillium digitatum Pd1]KAG0158296.1 hypothetical protein PDIDSM_5809 [Penicillium digitatum]QQK42426.1 Ankyrin repeats (3 copies) family protein [Penicillium digitatum]